MTPSRLLRGTRLATLLGGLLLGGAANAAEPPRPGGLVVITPERFTGELAAFLDHRRKEMPVSVASLESVLKESHGADDPERLKRFLYEAWRKDGIRYVLLVGDADLLPVRYMVLDRVTPAAFDTAFYPSDLYYADLTKPDGSFEDWNAAREGHHAAYYGEVRGEKNKDTPINFDAIDYRPELAVGRWPVSTAEEVRRIAAKTIAFEAAHADDTRSPVAGLIAVGGWVDGRPTLDGVGASLGKKWKIEKRYYADRRIRRTTPPTEKEVLDLLDGRADLLVHTGHGFDNGWDQCLSVESLAALKNANRPVVVFSAGCSTARFATLPPYEPYLDANGAEHVGTNFGEVFETFPPPPAPYQAGRFNPPGLGEKLLRDSEAGAVAYIGCNTGSQPCGLTLVEGFGRAYGSRKEPRLGDCWADAVSHYYDRQRLADLQPDDGWYPPSIFFQAMKFMVFGDPSLKLPAAGE